MANTLDEFDPGLTMMVSLLVILFGTIVAFDLQSGEFNAILSISVLGFFIVLGVISFRYHCVAKDVILDDNDVETAPDANEDH